MLSNLYVKPNSKYGNVTYNYSNKKNGILLNIKAVTFQEIPTFFVSEFKFIFALKLKKHFSFVQAIVKISATKSLKNGNYEKLYESTKDICKVETGFASNFVQEAVYSQFQKTADFSIDCPFKVVSILKISISVRTSSRAQITNDLFFIENVFSEELDVFRQNAPSIYENSKEIYCGSESFN